MIPEFACKAVDETTKALWLQKVYLRIVMDMREGGGMGFLKKKQVEDGFFLQFCPFSATPIF